MFSLKKMIQNIFETRNNDMIEEQGNISKKQAAFVPRQKSSCRC